MPNDRTLKYKTIDLELLKDLPELIVPHRKLMDEWEHDESPQYIIFESMFRVFIEILLNTKRDSTEKEKLLKRSFEFIEKMFLFGDDAVIDLAWIAMFEGKPAWYFGLSHEYWGPQTYFFVSKHEDRLQTFLKSKSKTELKREFIDLYGVRESILRKLKASHFKRVDIPGISYPTVATSLKSLKEAKRYQDGVAFLACYGSSRPYVVISASQVRCGERALKALLLDLVQYDREEPQQERKAKVSYFRIPDGERIWNMKKGRDPHGRYSKKLWIKEKFVQKGFGEKIRSILFDGQV